MIIQYVLPNFVQTLCDPSGIGVVIRVSVKSLTTLLTSRNTKKIFSLLAVKGMTEDTIKRALDMHNSPVATSANKSGDE